MRQRAMTGGGREYPHHPRVGIGVALLRQGADGGVEVLLIRRARPPAQGQWSLPGGAQHLGETAEQAARRELLEETGLTCGKLVLAGHVDSIHRDDAGAVQYHYTIVDFGGLWTGGEAVAGDDADAVRWAAEADFAVLEVWPEVLRIFQAARALLRM